MKRYPQWEFKFQDDHSRFGIADPVPVTPEQIHLDKAWSIERSTRATPAQALKASRTASSRRFRLLKGLPIVATKG